MTLRIIGGQYKGRALKTPKHSRTRPTQGVLREAVFNICQAYILDARFLDLFAGSGAMGLEALSRGACHATFVENDLQAIRCIRENIATLHLEEQTSLFRSLEFSSPPFHIAYLDPPYETPISPFLKELLPHLAPNALVFVEERYAPNKSIPEAPSLLQHIDTRRFGIALLHKFRIC